MTMRDLDEAAMIGEKDLVMKGWSRFVVSPR